MGASETRSVMEAYTSEGAALGDFIHEAAVYRDVRTGREHVGHAGIGAMFREYYQEQLDAEATLLNAIVGEDWFACEYRMTGRHVGEFAGKTGTGEAFTADFAVFYRVDDGKIVGAHIYFPSEQVTEP